MSQKADSVVHIQLPQDFPRDSESGFQAELTRVVQEAPQEVWLNCAAIERITSNGVGVLWKAYQQCAEVGVELKLSSPSRGLVRALAALDLNEFFGIPTSAEAGSYRPSEPTEPSTGVFSDSFEATETGINEAIIRFGDHVRTLQLDSDAEFELQTLFYEVATNVRQHGDMKTGEPVQVAFVAQQDKLTLSFTDTSSPFDPTQHSVDYDFKKAAGAGQTRGFGIALIHRMVDSMSYSRLDETHNMLTLIKQRSA